MKQPSFSICIPNYNYGHYIGETIQSILNQTYQNFEIIVADNASTDNSVEVIKSFDDDRIRLIQNNCNIGYSPNLHKATSCAQNDFILFLPSDDLLKKETQTDFSDFEKEIAALKYDTEKEKNIKKNVLFHFNPNTLNDEGWLALGLSKSKLKTLRNYQKSGGYFRTVDVKIT